MTRILEISASGRRDGSLTRTLTADLISALAQRDGDVELTRRDLGDGLPFVDEAWIDANFTQKAKRSDAQKAALAESDALVAELEGADIVVIGSPIYNFGVPAALKAWIDMVARAGVTFRYTKDGPEGLLEDKKAYVVVASGGVAIDSAADFATPYLRQALRFVGISDITVIGAAQAGGETADVLDRARANIAEHVYTQTHAA